MKTTILATAATIFLAGAAPQPAQANECAARAAELVRQSGAKLVRQSDYYVFLDLDGFSELNIGCSTPSLDIAIDTPMPPDAFFGFTAIASQIAAGVPARMAKAAAIECTRRALRHPGEQTAATYKNAEAECAVEIHNLRQVSRGRTQISIYKRQR
jgi:hypothetical protein